MSAFKGPLDPSTALGGFPGNNYSEVIFSSLWSCKLDWILDHCIGGSPGNNYS